MGKKKKLNKKKFISRITLLLLIAIIIIFVINTISKNNNVSIQVATLIVDNEDVTSSLNTAIYIDKDGTLYMAIDDIKNIFDENLYYEEETNTIITTSQTKVGAIDLSNNTVQINSATILLSAGIINYDTGYYIPISEITSLYNIEITTTENSAVISSLYKELITVEASKKISLKENPSTFSSTIQKIDSGTKIIYIEDADKNGWIKVLTYEGKIGYVKENQVSDKNYERVDMEISSNNVDLESSIEITKKSITEDNLSDFSSRKEVIEDIILEAITNEKYTININLSGVDVGSEKLERFIIELLPRIKEIGGGVAVTNNEILSSEFLNENNI